MQNRMREPEPVPDEREDRETLAALLMMIGMIIEEMANVMMKKGKEHEQEE